MLNLYRRSGESLVIGDEVVITVLDVVGNQVTLGVKAPPTVEVEREEFYMQRLRDGGQTQPNMGEQREFVEGPLPEEKQVGTDVDEDCLHKGYVEKLFDKGYGFIYVPLIEDNIFFHYTDLLNLYFDDLYHGMDVQFKVIENDRGLVAIEVEPSHEKA